MPNYQDGKIYSIRSNQTTKYYLGSTIQSLSKRFHKHKTLYCSSKEIMKYEDAYIELIENYPCNSKEELNRREGELIRLHKDNLVNINIAGRTKKEYLEEHKAETSERTKIWRETNNEKYKTYLEDNRDIRNEKYRTNYNTNNEIKLNSNLKNRNYYYENKASINQRQKQYRERKKAEKLNSISLVE